MLEGSSRRGNKNIFLNLRNREIYPPRRDPDADLVWKKQQFKGFELKVQANTSGLEESKTFQLSYLQRPSKIAELVVAEDILFVLTQSGVCVALERLTFRLICYLNVEMDEMVRSLFFNKVSRSIITVSVYERDNFSSLKCRTTDLIDIKRKQPERGSPLFDSESLKYPGFVEFDDVNKKVLTHSAQHRVYKVWDLSNYDLCYTLREQDISEIKISPGIMLLIFPKQESHVRLKIICIETGEELRQFHHLLHRKKKIDFIEQFNEKLLVKQEAECLQIKDVRTNQMLEVRNFATKPTTLQFLYENQLFLTFLKSTVLVWNFRGEMVTRFEDHTLWHQHSDCSMNNICINSQQDILLSYCQINGVTNFGSINISHILTGKLLGKISVPDSEPPEGFTEDEKAQRQRQITALSDVTALLYNEEYNEIYTGNRQGMLHRWA